MVVGEDREAPPGTALAEEDLDSARLVDRVQAGEQPAFATLYTRYFDRVFSYLKLVLNNPVEAEDATQQVFLQAFQGLPAYEQRDKPFRSWLYTIMRNCAIDHLRRIRGLELAEIEEVNRQREANGIDSSPLDSLDWLRDTDLVLFIEHMPLPQRQALLMRYMLDLSYAQIGQILGRRESDARLLHHRGVAFLRKRLTAIGRGPERKGEKARMKQKVRQAPVLRLRRYALK